MVKRSAEREVPGYCDGEKDDFAKLPIENLQRKLWVRIVIIITVIIMRWRSSEVVSCISSTSAAHTFALQKARFLGPFSWRASDPSMLLPHRINRPKSCPTITNHLCLNLPDPFLQTPTSPADQRQQIWAPLKNLTLDQAR